MNVMVKSTELKGSLEVVSSKSLLHRYIIMASLLDTNVCLKNVDLSEDINCTIEAFKTVGKTIIYDINSRNLYISNKINIRNDYCIYVGESGSTLRFLIPIFIQLFNKIEFYGKESLLKRPLNSYFPLFDENQIKYHKKENHLYFEGEFKSNAFKIAGDISSQFVSGLLFMSILKEGFKEVTVLKKIESIDYINLTIKVISQFNIIIENIKKDNVYRIFDKINRNYKVAYPIVVEPDFSQCAYYFVAGALHQNLEVLNIEYNNSLQGDKIILEYLKKAGANVKITENSISVNSGYFIKTSFDLKNCPDLGPILFVFSLFIPGNTLFYNIKRLRYKESNRIEAMLTNFKKIGINWIEKDNYVLIKKCNLNKIYKKNIVFDSFNDHRIAISLAILCSKLKGMFIIKNFEAINKSYPSFINDYKKIGGLIFEK